MRLVFAAIALLLLPAQDKLTLKFLPKAGDRLEIVEKSTADSKTNYNGEEEESTRSWQRKALFEYVEVDGEKIVKKTVDIAEEFETRRSSDEEDSKKKDCALKGKKVTLTVKGDETTFEGADALEESDRKSLRNDERYAKWLPAKAVGLGETWEVAAETLKNLMTEVEITAGKATLTLKEIKEIDKRSCAVLATRLDATARSRGDWHSEYKMAGEMTVWVDRGYPLAATWKGTMKRWHGEKDEPDAEGTSKLVWEMTATLKEK